MVVMYAGSIVEQAPAAVLYSRPRHPYTIGLLGSIARLDQPRGQRARAIPGAPPALDKPLAGCAFAARCSLRFEKCVEAPPLFPTGDGAAAACWHLSGGNR
jgi:oligopeptide/dipeptide ABC transporter ATP-binding protein